MSEVPVLGDMVFVSCLRSLLDKGVAMYGGIEQTAMMRLRPVLTSTMLTLLVSPVFYSMLSGNQKKP